MTDACLKSIISQISKPDDSVIEQAQQRVDSLTKPQGSLGRLEECAIKYVAARNDVAGKVAKPTILTFAGDHGVAEEGVSAFPQEVTVQMVANFAHKGAAINVLTKHAGADLKVIDIGVASPCDFPNVITKKVACGTANFVKGPAMTLEETEQALKVGIEVAQEAIDNGSTLLGTGDMGIANTTPSAALYSAFLNIPPAEIAGRGTGIDDERLNHKISIIEKALEVNKGSLGDPLSTLAALGGFEIAGICGAILAAAANNVPIVIDGFISCAAAVTAIQFNENVKEYCFFSHLSAEAGHINIMEELEICPLLDFELRLGEGTGASLAFNVIEAAVKVMHEMATFAEAGVAESK